MGICGLYMIVYDCMMFKRSSCQVKLQECRSSNWEDSRSGEEAWAATNQDQKEIEATDM